MRKSKKSACNKSFSFKTLLSLFTFTQLIFTNVYATSSTGNLALSASVTNSCTVAGGSVAFGAYTRTQKDASGTFRVTCTTGAAYTIALNAGANPSAAGDVATRRLRSGTADYISYQLYSNTGRTTVWGNTTGTNTVAGTGNGAAQSQTVYGRITASQNVPAGTYTDTVLITVTF